MTLNIHAPLHFCPHNIFEVINKVLVLTDVCVLNLTTGQTQLSELVNLDTSKKPQLLSEVQTQITNLEETTETGDLIHTLTVICLASLRHYVNQGIV